MCTNPILIKNPNKGAKFSVGDALSLKDCTSTYLKVPCGHCDECIANKQMQLVQRVQMQCIDYIPFYCTLSYKPSMLPSLTTSTGYNFSYADIRDFTNMVKMLKKHHCFDGRNFKYFLVSERGSKKGRPHFHAIFFVKRCPDDNYLKILNLETNGFNEVLSHWVRYSKVGRYAKKENICDYVVKYIDGKRSSNYDFHYITTSFDKTDETSVAFYCLKYMLKTSERETKLQRALKLNLPPDEYYSVWSKIKSRWTCSKGFGDPTNFRVQTYLSKCVQESKKDSEFPQFINPNTGQRFPLSKYFRKFPAIYSFKDALHFYLSSDSPYDDNFIIDERSGKELSQIRQAKKTKNEKISNRYSNDGIYDTID